MMTKSANHPRARVFHIFAFFRIDREEALGLRGTRSESPPEHLFRHTSASASRSWTLTSREQPASSMVTP